MPALKYYLSDVEMANRFLFDTSTVERVHAVAIEVYDALMEAGKPEFVMTLASVTRCNDRAARNEYASEPCPRWSPHPSNSPAPCARGEDLRGNATRSPWGTTGTVAFAAVYHHILYICRAAYKCSAPDRGSTG